MSYYFLNTFDHEILLLEKHVTRWLEAFSLGDSCVYNWHPKCLSGKDDIATPIAHIKQHLGFIKRQEEY